MGPMFRRCAPVVSVEITRRESPPPAAGAPVRGDTTGGECPEGVWRDDGIAHLSSPMWLEKKRTPARIKTVGHEDDVKGPATARVARSSHGIHILPVWTPHDDAQYTGCPSGPRLRRGGRRQDRRAGRPVPDARQAPCVDGTLGQSRARSFAIRNIRPVGPRHHAARCETCRSPGRYARPRRPRSSFSPHAPSRKIAWQGLRLVRTTT